ncbi:MAG: hypothetical protein LBG64_04260 [Pseudomonadales bacterium]|jgi:prolyl-tRNA synthetase|nr:hypothetical protein [Pseudomonadales bacterium]
MKLSKLLFKPLKNPPANAETINHKLLVQGGFVRQLMAGVYSYTPLGLIVLNKISQIVREEMNATDSQEIHMPALHPKQNWVQTGGWDGIDVLFKIKSRTDKDYALGQSHEEVVTPLVKELILNEKSLPISLYQIQWKFRDELRAKSGIMRGREFLMKDMYSFHATQDDFDSYYQIVKEAYFRVYKRLGLEAKATEASGGNFTDKISYEFMVLTDAGEDDILYCDKCTFAVNTEISDQKAGEKCTRCGQGVLNEGKASEAGNVFDLGTKFSEAFDTTFTDSNNKKIAPIMGCYGIGISRNMGIIVEKHADEKGIAWPVGVAPFQVEIIGLKDKESEAEALYKELVGKGIEVLLDDTDNSPGAKFACADLIGCPYRVVLSSKNGDQLEVKARSSDEATLMDKSKLLDMLK